jgi:hypothetical protein
MLTTALLAAVPATADAAVFRGDTSQGRPASLVIGSDGLLRAARVNWRTECRSGRFKTKTSFLRPHDASAPESFRDSGTYRTRGAGYRFRTTASVRGHKVGERRWRGRFSAKVLVTRDGRYVDTCRLRRLNWSVRLVG